MTHCSPAKGKNTSFYDDITSVNGSFRFFLLMSTWKAAKKIWGKTNG